MGIDDQRKARRIPVYFNIAIFIFGGIVFLIGGKNITGTLLLAAGGLNSVSLLLSENKNVRYYFVLYLINACLALYVSYDYYFSNSRYIHIAWLAIAIVYFVVSMVFLRNTRKVKSKK